MSKLMNQRWFIALVFMVIYKPTIFSQMPQLATLDTITDIFKIAVLAVLLMWFLLFYQKVSLFFVSIAFLQFWRIICTVYNGGNYTSLILTILNALALVLVVEMGLKTDTDALLDGAVAMLGTYVVLNSLTIFIFPQGMYEFNTYTENYLFGYRNNMIMMIMPAVIFAVVRSYRYFNRLSFSSYLIFGCALFSVFRAFSATAVIGTVILTVIVLMVGIGFMPKIFNIVTYIAVNIAYFFGVIIMRVQEMFAFIIVDMLGKDLTFTGRTSIWDRALEAFYASPLFGVGEISNDSSRDLIGATHAHNYYLDLLYKSGIVGFLIFIIILIICGVALHRSRSGGKIPFFVSGTLFAFMFMLQSEAYYNVYLFYSVLTLAAFIKFALPAVDDNGSCIFKKTNTIKRKWR